MKFLDRLMAPLGKDYCMLFYILGICGILLSLFSFGGLISGIFMKSPGYVTMLYIFPFVYGIFLYYINRIQYSICIAAIR